MSSMFVCGKSANKQHKHFKTLNTHSFRHKPHPHGAHYLEREILEFSGLKVGKELQVFDVPISFQSSNHYMHTYKCGEENSETLVLVHGYGGSSLFFFPMLKELSKEYRVFCVDLLGMGLSSRAEFPCSNAEETIDYFVESLEKWREALKLEEFQLAGHSFGGYMSAQYSFRYQQRVKKLFLLSPAGLTKHEKETTAEEMASKLNWIGRRKFYYDQKYWLNQVTPAAFFRKSGVLGKLVLKKYVRKQFGHTVSQQEKGINMIYKFCCELLLDEKGSEMAIFMILRPPLKGAEIPLEEDIANKLTIPVVCYYGEKDWMNTEGAERLEKSGEKDFKVKKIKNSGHQVTMQGSYLLTQDMLMEGLARNETTLVLA